MFSVLDRYGKFDDGSETVVQYLHIDIKVYQSTPFFSRYPFGANPI